MTGWEPDLHFDPIFYCGKNADPLVRVSERRRRTLRKKAKERYCSSTESHKEIHRTMSSADSNIVHGPIVISPPRSAQKPQPYLPGPRNLSGAALGPKALSLFSGESGGRWR